MAMNFLGWAPSPTQRESSTAGLGALLQSLGQIYQQNLFNKDVQALQNAMGGQSAVGAGGGLGVVEGLDETNPVTPRSNAMNQMMGQNLMQSLIPMSPYQKAMLEVEQTKARQISPTQQIANQKLQALNEIRGKLAEGEDVTKDLEEYKALYGSGQTINVGPGLKLTDKDKIQIALQLKSDFNARPAVKEYHTLAKNAGRMEIAYKRSMSGTPNAANDQALINTFNKMLDELSVVRESEYARTGAGLSAINRVRGYMDKLRGGGAGLTAEDREDIYNISQEFLALGRKMYDDVYYDMENTIEAAELDRRIVFGGRKPFVTRPKEGQVSQGQAPQAGQAFAPITDATDAELTNAMARAKRRLGPNATKAQIMQKARELIEAERSLSNPLKRSIMQGVR